MSLFYWFLDSVIVNAYICSTFRFSAPDSASLNNQLEFRKIIIYDLIGYSSTIPATVPISSPPHVRRRLNNFQSMPATRVVNARHLPVRKSRGRCQWCELSQGKQKQTNYKCRECLNLLPTQWLGIQYVE